MSRENVDTGLAGMDALNRRDVDAVLAVCDPDIEFHAYFSEVTGGTFRGHSGMREYLREIQETFTEFVVEVDSVEDRGDLVVSRLSAHGRSFSGAPVTWRVVTATRFRDGKVWRMASCPTESEALEAVGLRE